MSSTSSATRFATMRLGEFNEAFAAVYLGASSIGADDLAVLSRPFLWWDDVRITFEEIEQQMRNVMARCLGLLSLHSPPPGKSMPFHVEQLDVAVRFLDAYVNRQEVEVPETTNPVRALGHACYSAKKLIAKAPESILARVPEMATFHEGWRGLLPDALIDLDDLAAFEMFDNTCSELICTENLVYTLVRRHGSTLLAPIEELLPKLLPADQLLWLHGLDAFPKHDGVIALYERVLATTESPSVRETTTTYLDRVRSGLETTGFEI